MQPQCMILSTSVWRGRAGPQTAWPHLRTQSCSWGASAGTQLQSVWSSIFPTSGRCEHRCGPATTASHSSPALPTSGVSPFGPAQLATPSCLPNHLDLVCAPTSPRLWRQVLEAFVSYDRVTGRPRGFGFVVFEDPSVADRVASLQHTIDRREVETLALWRSSRCGQAPLSLLGRLRSQPGPLGAPATPVRHLLSSRSTPVRNAAPIAAAASSHEPLLSSTSALGPFAAHAWRAIRDIRLKAFALRAGRSEESRSQRGPCWPPRAERGRPGAAAD